MEIFQETTIKFDGTELKQIRADMRKLMNMCERGTLNASFCDEFPGLDAIRTLLNE